MISSTRSSESALRSSMNEASGTTSASSTLSSFEIIFLRRPSALAGMGYDLLRIRILGYRSTGWNFVVGSRADHPAEDTVDKSRRAFAAVQLGELDRLVDGDAYGDCSIPVENFKEPQPQNISVDRRELGDRVC